MTTEQFCQNCGAPFDAGMRFCGHCGTSVTGEHPDIDPPAAEDRPPPVEPVAEEPPPQPAARPMFPFMATFAPLIGCMPFLVVIIMVLAAAAVAIVLIIAVVIGAASAPSPSPQSPDPPPAPVRSE